MLIPRIRPRIEIPVDGVQKQLVKEPDLPVVVRAEVVVVLKEGEEIVPLVEDALRYVDPKALYANVIDTPECRQ